MKTCILTGPRGGPGAAPDSGRVAGVFREPLRLDRAVRASERRIHPD